MDHGADSPPAKRRPEEPLLHAERGPVRDITRAAARPLGALAGWPFSVAAHLTVFAALVWPRAEAPHPHAMASPIVVSVVEMPAAAPQGPPAPQGGANASPHAAQPAASPDIPPEPEPLPEPVAAPRPEPKPAPLPKPVREIAAASAPDTSDLLSDSQLAGAIGADDEAMGHGGGGTGGSGGGGCNTVRALQLALQRSPVVRGAVESAGRLGKAVMLWNGDWVRAGGQDGKGLSGVREAIIWELAFAPESCRNMRVRGLVVLSLADGTRFAIGTDDWRWSDLLGLRRALATDG